MDIRVRAATAADAGLIAALTRASWAGIVAPGSSGHRENERNVAAQLLAGGGFIVTVGLAAAGSVRWLPLDSDPETWEMLRMGIIPAHRRRNLSHHLLDAVIQHAGGRMVRELRLAVRSDQPRLLDFYAARGFEIAPELTYSHANPLEPAPTVMRRQLMLRQTPGIPRIEPKTR